MSKEDKYNAAEGDDAAWRAGGEGCCEVEMVVGGTCCGAEARV